MKVGRVWRVKSMTCPGPGTTQPGHSEMLDKCLHEIGLFNNDNIDENLARNQRFPSYLVTNWWLLRLIWFDCGHMELLSVCIVWLCLSVYKFNGLESVRIVTLFSFRSWLILIQWKTPQAVYKFMYQIHVIHLAPFSLTLSTSLPVLTEVCRVQPPHSVTDNQTHLVWFVYW